MRAGRRVVLAVALCVAFAPLPGEELPYDRAWPYRSPAGICVDSPAGLAYVANQSANTVSVIDLKARRVVSEFPVDLHPTHLVLSPDRRTLYLSCRYAEAVDVIDVGRREVVRRFKTGFEPYGLALTRDGKRLYVANALSGTVSALDTSSGRTLAETETGHDPRYPALTPDEKTLVVFNGLSRDVAILDAATLKRRELRRIGRASMVRQALCTPDGRWAVAAHLESHEEAIPVQIERGWIHSNGITLIDLRSPGRYVTLLLDQLLSGAANPWGAVVSPDGKKLYVSLSGIHKVAIVDLPKALRLAEATKPDPVEIDLLSKNVEVVEAFGLARRVDAGGLGPRIMALDPPRGLLLVANFFTDDVSLLDAETGALRATVPLGPPAEMTLRRKGELLFSDGRICYQGWFSCASCHGEDADADSLTWDLPNDGTGNPKNTKSMHDFDTPPAMWGGVREDMADAVNAGFRFQGFLASAEDQAAMVAYISAPQRAPNPFRKHTDPAVLKRGEELFRAARCDSCHPGPKYTDMLKHDVGIYSQTDLFTRIDTPTLREVYRSPPYLHDGRAATLKDVFTTCDPEHRHGRTNGFTPADLDALVAYVKSL